MFKVYSRNCNNTYAATSLSPPVPYVSRWRDTAGVVHFVRFCNASRCLWGDGYAPSTLQVLVTLQTGCLHTLTFPADDTRGNVASLYGTLPTDSKEKRKATPLVTCLRCVAV